MRHDQRWGSTSGATEASTVIDPDEDKWTEPVSSKGKGGVGGVWNGWLDD